MGMAWCCSFSVAPVGGYQAAGVTQEIPRHTGREGRRGLLEAGCLCPLGKRVLVLGVVLGPGFISPCTVLWMRPQLSTLSQET